MKALVLVDIQNDFLLGGSLEVPGSDQILPAVKELLKKKWDQVIATKDWHPKKHVSFASRHGKKPGETILFHGQLQALWPDHCVQNSPGAEYSSIIDPKKINFEVKKGIDLDLDCYSDFRSTDLLTFLKNHQIADLYFVGLVTDWCVKASVLDALEMGFQAFVIKEGVKALNIHPGDEERAFKEMEEKGAKIISIHDL